MTCIVFSFFLVLTFFPFSFAFSQKTGKVEMIVGDYRINTLAEKHKTWCDNRGSIKGFRIQIFFDSGNNSKSKAISAMSEFRSKHSKVEAYLMFQEPNYKVRVGDFRTRMDAQRFLHKIADAYPNAFIVKDNEINFPPLDEEED
ncbi:MAG: SPOR domain-containing protein [Bacteroidota bacterium]